MLVVVEPSQASVDCARRIFRMASEIGIKDIRPVANKVTSQDDERFLGTALDGRPLVGVIPYCGQLRTADRSGRSVLDQAGPEAQAAFAAILAALDKGANP
jgi:CO dehydrogenase maturation factor